MFGFNSNKINSDKEAVSAYPKKNVERVAATVEERMMDGIDFVFKQIPQLASIGSKESYSEYIKTIFPDTKVKYVVYHGSEKGEKRLPIVGLKYGKRIEEFSEEGRDDHIKQRGHGRANDIGFYFSPSPANEFYVDHRVFTDFHWGGAKNYGDHIYPVLLNFKNPANSDHALNLTDKAKDELKSKGYDSMIGDSDLTIVKKHGDLQLIKEPAGLNRIVEYIAFEPSQVYVLGSQRDMKNFKEFIGNQKKSVG